MIGGILISIVSVIKLNYMYYLKKKFGGPYLVGLNVVNDCLNACLSALSVKIQGV